MDGAPLSEEQEQAIWADKLPGHEYLMSVAAVDDNGFRDELGRLRPKEDAAAYVGRTVQELVWDSRKQEWQIEPPLNYVGLLDPTTNPAAYANDALFQVLDGVSQLEEYTKQDALLNALVMVPKLRKVAHNTHEYQSGKEFEFCSMWFYPRRGWAWAASDEATADAGTNATDNDNRSFGSELTVGYFWPLHKPQPDAYAQFCSVS